MVIALLAVLGVDLIVIVAFVAFVLGRKRWVKRQPNAFLGVIRVAGGDIDGFGPKWRRGYGRWVRDVLVWTKAPLLFQNELMAVDGLAEQRPARGGDEIRRLGDHPAVIKVRVGGARAEIAAEGDDLELLLGPHGKHADDSVGGSPIT